MKIVILSEWYSEKMGYAENELPRALGALGPEVHLVASNLQPDFPDYDEAYAPFLGPREVAVGTTEGEGFTVHRLMHGMVGHGVWMKGLYSTLSEIRPDIVQTFTIPSYSTYQAAAYSMLLGYRLFLEEHFHRSVFRPGPRGRLFFKVFRRTGGPFLSAIAEKCYPIAPDVAQLATAEFGISSDKMELCPLGVSTDMFRPADTPALLNERRQTRVSLGLREDEIVCVYSGRFHPGKDPLTLARAVGIARKQDPRIRGLFIGSGTSEEVRSIRECDGCSVHPFVPARDLPPLYRAADIGVWPRQESTSQLDAVASGLPIIISNRVEATERIDGNGASYSEGDPSDLAKVILTMLNEERRSRMASVGVKKVRELYGWDRIARSRLADYSKALNIS